MPISVKVVGGPAIEVPWTNGMNAQQALERAEDALKDKFLYSIEYYGSDLGYLVNMINETYDTFSSKGEPFFYWEFLVNGVPSPKGIDNVTLNDGDMVNFEFTSYCNEAESVLTAAKHRRRCLR